MIRISMGIPHTNALTEAFIFETSSKFAPLFPVYRGEKEIRYLISIERGGANIRKKIEWRSWK